MLTNPAQLRTHHVEVSVVEQGEGREPRSKNNHPADAGLNPFKPFLGEDTRPPIQKQKPSNNPL
ncbi:hypothetical protein P186_1091 [Pyrobaculum ferrireducens]|uniref:Uncharacterized protein n=1 Tax=Pyrobaculum ferrireducens TaxID=1104324 RepID=G7VC27_9CREN|nr:hypothetical protein P186_1091 [Pyrobaculum ferrireducens]